MAKKILTLNIGAADIELAEFAASGGKLELVNYGVAALAAPPDADNAFAVLPPAILEIVREKGIKPGRVAISLSGQMVFPRVASIPASGGERFEQLVRYEIEQNVPFPIDEMVCDRAVLGDTESGEKSVMIVAAKVAQVEAMAAAVASVGFVPEMVDVAPVALVNLAKAAGGDAGGCCVVLDIGARTSSLVIVEGEKIYNRSIPVAGNAITKEISQILGCTQEEAERVKRENAYVSLGGAVEDEDETLDRISKACRAVMTRIHAEISRSINFYRSQQGGGAPARLYLAGGTSLLPQTDAFFADSLQIEVAYLNPFEVVSASSSLDAAALEADAVLLVSAAGVALHAAGRAAVAIDLMPPSLVEARAEFARIPFVAVGATAAIAAAACFYFSAMSDTSRLEEENAAVSAEATRLENVQRGIDAAAADEQAAVAAATNLASRLARRSVAVSRLHLVRAALEPELWIAKWEDTVAKTQTTVRDIRGRETTVEKETPVTRVTVRGWKDLVGRLVERESTIKEDAPEGDGAPSAGGTGRSAGKLTAGMIVVKRLESSGVPVPGSVKIVEGRNLGKDGCLEQFVVEMQFKEPGTK